MAVSEFHEPSESDVREQIERITASTTFDRSDRLVRFLRFIADAALRGDTQSLKEWVIGSEVYGRGDEFDPRIDSIVRTEARRLRRKLKDYYQSDGPDDPVIVDLPTGSYEPLFRFRTGEIADIATGEEPVEAETEADEVPPEQAARPPVRSKVRPAVLDWLTRLYSKLRDMPQRHWQRISAGLLICVAVLLFFLIRQRTSRDPVHRLLVMSPRFGTTDKDGQQLVDSFVQDLATQLGVDGGVKIIEPKAAEALAREGLSIPEIASRLGADHVLLETAEKNGSSCFLILHMLRASDSAPVWAGRFDCSWKEIGEDEFQTLSDLLAYVHANSPGAHGLSDHLRSPVSSEAYTRAVNAFGNFSVSRDKLDGDYAARQLTVALALNPDFEDARVLLARLRFEQLSISTERNTLLAEIRSLMERVLKSEPKRPDALALLGQAYWEMGDHERGAQLVQEGVALGPLNPIVRSAMARLDVALGFFESAVVESDRSFALDANNFNALAFKVLCSYWTNRPGEAKAALNTMREWRPGAQTELFFADEQLREGNFPEAERLISTGRDLASADTRIEFDIADGLRLALMHNGDASRRIWQQYKDSPTGLSDHLILLAAQIGEADAAVHLIRQSDIYANYRYLAAERRLSPLYSQAVFQALLREFHSKWISDVKHYGSSLPVGPGPVPSPEEVLAQH